MRNGSFANLPPCDPDEMNAPPGRGPSRFVAFALSGVLMIFSGASYTFALFSPALKARLGGGQAGVQAVALAMNAGIAHTKVGTERLTYSGVAGLKDQQDGRTGRTKELAGLGAPGSYLCYP